VPIIVDRDEAQRLVGAGAQLMEVLPEHEYAEEHLPVPCTCRSNASTPGPHGRCWTRPGR
jgi:hypothetical protein